MVVTKHEPQEVEWDDVLRMTGFSDSRSDNLPEQFTGSAMKAGIMIPGQELLTNLFSRSIVLMLLSCMGLEQRLRALYNKCSIRFKDIYNLASNDEDDSVRLAATRCPLRPVDPSSEAAFDLKEGTEVTQFSYLNLLTHTIDVFRIPREEVIK
jgi:hypothetical protein